MIVPTALAARPSAPGRSSVVIGLAAGVDTSNKASHSPSVCPRQRPFTHLMMASARWPWGWPESMHRSSPVSLVTATVVGNWALSLPNRYPYIYPAAIQ